MLSRTSAAPLSIAGAWVVTEAVRARVPFGGRFALTGNGPLLSWVSLSVSRGELRYAPDRDRRPRGGARSAGCQSTCASIDGTDLQARMRVLRKLGESARHNGDTLLGLITDAQLIDSARHRRWLAAFVKHALDTPGNLELIQGWIAKWEPLADKAIDAYCAGLLDVADASASAKNATREFRRSLGL